MTKQEQLDALCMDMILYNAKDPKRIHHFMKVAEFAALIARGEGVDGHTQFLLKAVGYVHDIGIRAAEEKYGYQNGALQQEMGPDAARPLLLKNEFEDSDVERICFLIAHHHTYTDIDGIDYQILVEADFLVNLYEDHSDKKTIENVYERIFKTKTGKMLCQRMFM